jgi:hypothetical protein
VRYDIYMSLGGKGLTGIIRFNYTNTRMSELHSSLFCIEDGEFHVNNNQHDALFIFS